MLSGEDFAEVVVIPARFESPGFDAILGRLLVFEQIERHMPHDNKVLLTWLSTSQCNHRKIL